MAKRKLIICETTAAFIFHLRDLDGSREPEAKLSGYTYRVDDPIRALCGMEVKWDRLSSITSVSCRICKQEAGL